jgi:hypothetical protein
LAVLTERPPSNADANSLYQLPLVEAMTTFGTVESLTSTQPSNASAVGAGAGIESGRCWAAPLGVVAGGYPLGEGSGGLGLLLSVHFEPSQ